MVESAPHCGMFEIFDPANDERFCMHVMTKMFFGVKCTSKANSSWVAYNYEGWVRMTSVHSPNAAILKLLALTLQGAAIKVPDDIFKKSPTHG